VSRLRQSVLFDTLLVLGPDLSPIWAYPAQQRGERCRFFVGKFKVGTARAGVPDDPRLFRHAAGRRSLAHQAGGRQRALAYRRLTRCHHCRPAGCRRRGQFVRHVMSHTRYRVQLALLAPSQRCRRRVGVATKETGADSAVVLLSQRCRRRVVIATAQKLRTSTTSRPCRHGRGAGPLVLQVVSKRPCDLSAGLHGRRAGHSQGRAAWISTSCEKWSDSS
jgi:hypothetical protein